MLINKPQTLDNYIVKLLKKHSNLAKKVSMPYDLKSDSYTNNLKNKVFIFTHKFKCYSAPNPSIRQQHYNPACMQLCAAKNKAKAKSVTADFNLNQTMVSEANYSISDVTIAGLSAVKKLLLNRVCAVNNVLVPAYNRRSHSTSHTNAVTYQHRKVSKTFGYIAKKTLRFWIGLVLATCYGETTTMTNLVNTPYKPNNLSFALHSAHKSKHNDLDFGQAKVVSEGLRLNLCQKPTILLADAIETRAAVLLWRTQICKSVFHARQVINHEGFKCSKQDFLLELSLLPLNLNKQTHQVSTTNYHSLGYVNQWAELQPNLNSTNRQSIYYTVTGYSNWVSCGSALRLWH